MDKTVLVDPIVAIDSAWKSISAWFNRRLTKEQCEAYSEAHTKRYADQHFYLFKSNRRGVGLTGHTLSSYNLHGSNILEIIEQSLEEGTFVSLEKITIKEYAKNGGRYIPCCLRNCEYEGDWPPCIKKINLNF